MTVICPHCDRTFATANDLYNHAKDRHGRRAARALREPSDDDETSVADQLVEAMLNASMGEDVDEAVELMFPDEIADARRRWKP